MEGFLDHMLSIFPLIGLKVFEKADVARPPNRSLLYIRTKEIEAKGYEDSSGFVVCEGSLAAKGTTKSCHEHLKNLRNDLFKQGVLVETENGERWVFTQNRTFSSPSQAGGVVLGHGPNGRIVWKTANGETLKSLQFAAAGGRVDSEITENK